jgi:hypothetical protein
LSLSTGQSQWLILKEAGISLYNDPKALLFTGDESKSFEYLAQGWVDVAGTLKVAQHACQTDQSHPLICPYVGVSSHHVADFIATHPPGFFTVLNSVNATDHESTYPNPLSTAVSVCGINFPSLWL